MPRTKIQKIIIPRNWLFGRIAFVTTNLNSMLRENAENLTEEEYKIIRSCTNSLISLQNNKELNSSKLKEKINGEETIQKIPTGVS